MSWVLEAVIVFLIFLGGFSVVVFGLHRIFRIEKNYGYVKLTNLFNKLTANSFVAVLFGLVLSGIIQSPTALIITIVALVYGKLIRFERSLFVILGVNIGISIIVLFSSITGICFANHFLPFTLVIASIGIFLIIASNKLNRRTYGELLASMSLIFAGIYFMQEAVSPLLETDVFFTASSLLGVSPFLGFLSGVITRVITQSDMYTISTLKSIAEAGALSYNGAVYIIIGQNIGATIMPILASLLANRDAKRVSVFNCLLNLSSSLLYIVVCVSLFNIVRIDLATEQISLISMLVFNISLNIVAGIFLIIFKKYFVILSDRMNSKEVKLQMSNKNIRLKYLDDRVLMIPDYAVDCGIKEVVCLGEKVIENINLVSDILLKDCQGSAQLVYENEEIINGKQKMIIDYLIAISNLDIKERQKSIVKNLIHIVSDIEKVGDYCVSIAKQGTYFVVNDLSLMDNQGIGVDKISKHTISAFKSAIEARKRESVDHVKKVERYEEIVDLLEEELREEHVNLLTLNIGQVIVGAVYLDIISNYKKITECAADIASCVKEEIM